MNNIVWLVKKIEYYQYKINVYAKIAILIAQFKNNAYVILKKFLKIFIN